MSFAVLTGSKILPYIRHPHDIDCLVYCQSTEELLKMLNLKKQFKKLIPTNVHWLLREYPKDILPTVYAYEYHFINDDRLQFDIYDNRNIPDILFQCENALKDDARPKRYYHVYTMSCMLINGNYQLTIEEIERINRFHDMISTKEDYQIMLQKLEEAKAKYLQQQ